MAFAIFSLILKTLSHSQVFNVSVSGISAEKNSNRREVHGFDLRRLSDAGNFLNCSAAFLNLYLHSYHSFVRSNSTGRRQFNCAIHKGKVSGYICPPWLMCANRVYSLTSFFFPYLARVFVFPGERPGLIFPGPSPCP